MTTTHPQGEIFVFGSNLAGRLVADAHQGEGAGEG
jgi:hypothetical protein